MCPQQHSVRLGGVVDRLWIFGHTFDYDRASVG
jgi:hypothetical protein